MLNSSINRRPASWRARFVTAAVLLPLTLSVAALHAQAIVLLASTARVRDRPTAWFPIPR